MTVFMACVANKHLFSPSLASPVVVLDPKFLPELRNLPDDVLDFAGAIDEVSCSSITRFEHDEN